MDHMFDTVADYWPSVTSIVDSDYEVPVRTGEEIAVLLKNMTRKLNRMHQLIIDKNDRVEFIRKDVGLLRGDVSTLKEELEILRRRPTKPY